MRGAAIGLLLGMAALACWGQGPPRRLVARPVDGGDCVARPCVAPTNWAGDLRGTPDTRPTTWGEAGFVTADWQFEGVPAGMRVRVLRVYGDWIAWNRLGAPAAAHAGMLWGLETSAPEAPAAHLQNASAGCFLYLQGSVSGTGDFRAPFDVRVAEGGLLEADHVLRQKLAVFLNDTGQPVHMEATMTVVFRFEAVR